jgi:hypothetical protein
LACSSSTQNVTKKVGKLFSSQHSQRAWDKNFRTLYPLLENTEFEAYQREFPTEWEKAEEIRKRIPEADELFVLPTESCPIPNKSSENYQECLTKVSENLQTTPSTVYCVSHISHISSSTSGNSYCCTRSRNNAVYSLASLYSQSPFSNFQRIHDRYSQTGNLKK